jgi:cellulose synthase/poly-beta-1,6-N-acetylglucosamine synthase-like glycosyltransferase
LGGVARSSSVPGLSWLRLPRGGKAVALNAALGLLGTDVVLTVDADTLLEPGAVAAMRSAFAVDARLVAATGVLSPVCGRNVGGRVFQWFQTYEYVRNFLSRFAWMRADGLLLISGAFAGFRRDAVMAVGGFDADCLVEDYELIHRLRRYGDRHGLGWRTAVLGEARARTDAPGAVGAFLRQRRRWFGGFLQTQFWYRDMVGNRAYGRLGVWMLPVKAADTLQPIFGLTAFALLVDYAVTGRLRVLVPVGGIIFGKIAIDLCFHVWSVHLYRRWTGDRTGASFGYALLAAVIEPFSFQLLRHLGAALGWVMFLGRQRGWGRQERQEGLLF